MRVSVAMTTYNGEHYIEKQLDSLRLQTRKIDELVIVDDCSKDATFALIDNYIEKWQLKNWKLYSSGNNNGWIVNFYNAIEKTTGDIVFFCDQDDEWNENKIQIMTDTMLENEKISVLACRLRLIDSEGNELPDNPERIPFNSHETHKVTKQDLDCLFSYAISPGCTMAVRREYISKYNHFIYEEKIAHDAVYWKMGILSGTAYIFDAALINYRIHNNNASNPIVEKRHHTKKRDVRLNENKSMKDQMEIIKKIYVDSGEKDKHKLDLLNKEIEFFEEREKFLYSKINSIYFGIKWHKYYRSIKMFIGDILSRKD